MKDRLSALMDGELDDRSAAEVIEALGRDHEAVRTWRTYQLISDAMRESRLLFGRLHRALLRGARQGADGPRATGHARRVAEVDGALGGSASRQSRS